MQFGLVAEKTGENLEEAGCLLRHVLTTTTNSEGLRTATHCIFAEQRLFLCRNML